MSSSSPSFARKDPYDSGRKVRAHIFISGKVQGVYFRQNTQLVATRHDVAGWVRNLTDGRVEVLLEGYEVNVERVIEWCHAGPPGAAVNDVDIKYELYTGEFKQFDINY